MLIKHDYYLPTVLSTKSGLMSTMASGKGRSVQSIVNGLPAAVEHDLQRAKKDYTQDQLKILQQTADLLSVPVSTLHVSLAATINNFSRQVTPLHTAYQSTRRLLEPTLTGTGYHSQSPTSGTVGEGFLSESVRPNVSSLTSVESEGRTNRFTELPWPPECSNEQPSTGLTHGSIGDCFNSGQEVKHGFPTELNVPMQTLEPCARSEVGLSQGLRNANLKVGGFDTSLGNEIAESVAQQAGPLYQQSLFLPNSHHSGGSLYLEKQSEDLPTHARKKRRVTESPKNVYANSDAGRQVSELPMTSNPMTPFNSSRSLSVASPSNNLNSHFNAGATQPPSSSSALPNAADDVRRTVARHGPCSYVWKLPPKRRRRNIQTQSCQSKQKGKSTNANDRPHNVRQAFPDEETRRETALTRQMRACVRCRLQHIRCKRDQTDPSGECIPCKGLKGPKWLPCLRYLMTDASIYREQAMPFQLFSRRWQTMDLVDIADWASDEVKTIEVTQVFLHAPLKLQVKKFVPAEGDLITEVWTDSNGVVRTHDIPPYALVDMEKTAHSIEKFVDANIGTYIAAAMKNLDSLFWDTYLMAFKHSGAAKTEKERELILSALRLWVACRNTSNPHRISGDDHLGISTVDDPASPWHKYHPMPPLIMAQNECIFYTKLLRPMSSKVLKQLNELVMKNDKKHWLTVYLTTFILLHSCSMTTRRDWEYARQISLPTPFANGKSIAAHHIGAKILLAYFHYINKGRHPFSMVLEEKGVQEVANDADLSLEQTQFINDTAIKVKEKESSFESLKNSAAFGDDFYWVAQLYDDQWESWPAYT